MKFYTVNITTGKIEYGFSRPRQFVFGQDERDIYAQGYRRYDAAKAYRRNIRKCKRQQWGKDWFQAHRVWTARRRHDKAFRRAGMDFMTFYSQF